MEPENKDLVKKAAEAFDEKAREIEKDLNNRSLEEQLARTGIPKEQLDEPPIPRSVIPQGEQAPGYNPNVGLPRENDLEKPLDTPKVPQPEQPQPPRETLAPQDQPINPREQAPDIGKDYGDSLGNPGASPLPVNRAAEPAIPTDTQEQGTPRQRPNQLEQAKAEKEQEDARKKAEAENPEGKKQAPAEPEKNPEAPDSSKKAEEQPQDQQGNGYGALKRQQAPVTNNDGTSLARRNMEINNKVNQEKQQESGKAPANTKRPTSNIKDGESPSGISGLGARIRNAFTKGLTKRKSQNSVGKGNGKNDKNLSNSFKGAMKRKALAFLAAHPFAVVVIILIVFILIMLFMAEAENAFGGGGKRGTHCTYNLNGVTSTGSVELSNLKVELINCDGTASDYTVLETVDFEKYVLGVALAEIGPSSPDEAIKAQIIAARGFALTRNSGMCPGNPDNCFYGYNASTGTIRMRACEADQVYWDYDKDIYREDRGSISLYSPEVTSGTLWKSALPEQKKQELLELANSVKGEVLVDSNQNVVHTSYVASTSEQFIAGANEGKTYDQILASVYDTSDGLSKATCNSYGNIDYGDYVLSSEGTEILHQPLDSFLSSNGSSLEEFNALIAENVDKAGYGTRAGVVAAAVTLIAELGNNYGVKVPYYWGGGHYDGVVDGALGYWGSTECHTYANNTSYNYCGLDCSGFVPWAIKNGGFNMVQNLAGNFQNLPGVKRVSLSSSPVLEPGDLLESSGHIVLVVGVEEESGVYICAEASGNSSGVLFTRRSFTESGYWGVKMDGYYDTQARSQ